MSDQQKEVVELRICETEHLVLKANQVYCFTVDPNCKRCVELDQMSKVEDV